MDDWERRKGLVVAAFRRVWKLWRANCATLRVKMRAFEAFVSTTALYCAGASGFTWAQLRRVDVLQRKLLRQLLGVFHPNRISNVKLYERCQTEPWSIRIVRSRWQLFGHVLRQADDTPGRCVMDFYFSQQTACSAGGRANTIVQALNKDVRAALPDGAQLATADDLRAFQTYAAERAKWRKHVVGSVEAAYRRHLAAEEQHRHAARATRSSAAGAPHSAASAVQSAAQRDTLESYAEWFEAIVPERMADATRARRHRRPQSSVVVDMIHRFRAANGELKRRRVTTREVLGAVCDKLVIPDDEGEWIVAPPASRRKRGPQPSHSATGGAGATAKRSREAAQLHDGGEDAERSQRVFTSDTAFLDHLLEQVGGTQPGVQPQQDSQVSCALGTQTSAPLELDSADGDRLAAETRVWTTPDAYAWSEAQGGSGCYSGGAGAILLTA